MNKMTSKTLRQPRCAVFELDVVFGVVLSGCAALFGAYSLGFYDGIDDARRSAKHSTKIDNQ